MEEKDLIIGKEYYLDCLKIEKGIYIGRKSNKIGVFFKPTTYTGYLTEPDGSVGFISSNQNTPVES